MMTTCVDSITSPFVLTTGAPRHKTVGYTASMTVACAAVHADLVEK
jgi:hypothetical protein